MDNKGILIGIAAIIVVVGAVSILNIHYAGPSTISGQTTTNAGSGQQTPIFLTDPPIVPTGTTALTIVYSSVSVHAIGASGGSWVSGTGSGSINLLNLVNTSVVMGTAITPPNSTIDMIGFNVTSATITINGTTSNVTIPDQHITAHIVGNARTNATSGVLLDLSPTIAAIYTANSTVFVMVPSVKAIVIGNQNVSAHSVGSKETLNVSEKNALENAGSNISVVSSSIGVIGNSTNVSVTVKDNSNSSVVLRHISIFGNYSVMVPPNAGFNTTVRIGDTGSISESGGDSNGIGIASENKGSVTSRDGKVTLNITSIETNRGDPSGNTGNSTADTNQSVAESGLISEGIDTQHMRMFNFLINQNGTLSLPSINGEAQGQNLGYNLTSGATATFTFSGKVSFGEGRITITPTSGAQYNVVVSGEGDASASANVTAK